MWRKEDQVSEQGRGNDVEEGAETSRQKTIDERYAEILARYGIVRPDKQLGNGKRVTVPEDGD
jgi:hypothetical protein